MDQPTPPAPEAEFSNGLYSDEEKERILAEIEAAAGANRLTVDAEVFRPRKQGVLFPVVVNVMAVALIVGAWFGAEAYFQSKEKGLTLRTDKLFSTESKLLAKVLEESKAQMEAANAQIDKIQSDLKKAANDKAALQKSFEDRVAARDKALRQEMADALNAEKERLKASGLSESEVALRLRNYESQKSAEFNQQLEGYRRQAQAEIDQRTQALAALQNKLNATVADQERLRLEVEKQNREREGSLRSQLSIQASDLEALQKERDDLNLYFRQAEASMAALRSLVETRDWAKVKAATASLKQVLTRAAASASDSVKARATAQKALAESFEAALTVLEDSTSRSESMAQIEALKAQLKKEQAATADQAQETQTALATVEALRTEIEARTNRLGTSSLETIDAQIQILDLSEKIRGLEAQIAELVPFRERSEALTALFSQSYPSARERFLATFESVPGGVMFPGFDEAWAEVAQQWQEAADATAVRKKALEEVLAFTTYLQGKANQPDQVKASTEKLMKADVDFKKVVDGIQALATSGTAETAIRPPTAQLYGTVAATSGTKVMLEPLTKVRPKVGDTIELRRAQGSRETTLGRGTVKSASNTRIELEWNETTSPLSGDTAYLVLP